MALFIRLLTILCVPGQAFKCCPQSHFPLGPLNVIAQSCIVRWFFRNVCHVKSELTVLNSVTLGQKWPSVQFSSVQSLSRVWLFVTPWITASQASLSITISWSSLKLTSIESVMPSSHLIFCCALLLLPSIPRSIKVFSNESTLLMRWPKYWSFSFSIIPSKEYPELISFRMDWLDLFAVRGTLKSLPQHHSSKASILQCSTFFTSWGQIPSYASGDTKWEADGDSKTRTSLPSMPCPSSVWKLYNYFKGKPHLSIYWIWC